MTYHMIAKEVTHVPVAVKYLSWPSSLNGTAFALSDKESTPTEAIGYE